MSFPMSGAPRSYAARTVDPDAFWRARAARGRYEEIRARHAAGEDPRRAVERAELRAVLPGEHGLECTLYEYVAHTTVHLRKKVYVALVVEDGEFRPGKPYEHTPRAELQSYQLAHGLLGGETPYGEGRRLEVTFVCYSPEGSGAAEEAVEAIRGALRKLREVVTWPDRKRSWFGMRHGAAWTKRAKQEGLDRAYRPPLGALPYRSGPPKPPGGVAEAGFRGRLERWGLLEDWDRRRAERKTRAAEASASTVSRS